MTMLRSPATSLMIVTHSAPAGCIVLALPSCDAITHTMLDSAWADQPCVSPAQHLSVNEAMALLLQEGAFRTSPELHDNIGMWGAPIGIDGERFVRSSPAQQHSNSMPLACLLITCQIFHQPHKMTAASLQHATDFRA